MGSCYKYTDPDEFVLSIKSLFISKEIPSEVLLVIDGPISEFLNINIQNLSKIYPLKIIRFKKNKGLGNALREGIKNCTYEFVLRFDTDDISVKDRLKKQYQLISNNKELVLVGSYVKEFKIINGVILSRRKKVPIESKQIRNTMFFRNPFNHPTVIFRKSIILSVGNYKHCPLFEDYYLWLRLNKNNYLMKNIPEDLVFMKRGSASLRRIGFDYLRKEIEFIIKITKHSLLDYYQVVLFTSRLIFRIYPISFILEKISWRSNWDYDEKILLHIKNLKNND